MLLFKGVSNLHRGVMVGVAGDPRGWLGLARRLIHPILQNGARAPGTAWMAGDFC